MASSRLAGVEARGGKVVSMDIQDCSKLYEGHPLWAFIQGDSRNPELPAMARASTGVAALPVDGRCFDLLLVDTEHTIAQVSAELALWAPLMRPGGHICIHDPETFPGVRRAVTEFCREKGWPVTFVLPCNGMAVIEVPHQPKDGLS